MLSKRSERRNRAKSKVEDASPKVISHKASSPKAVKKNFLDTNYKKLIIVPLVIFVLAIVQIVGQTAITGDFINKGVSLAGGTSIFVEKDWDAVAVEDALNAKFSNYDTAVRELTNAGVKVGITIETTAFEEADRTAIIELLNSEFGELESGDYTVEYINSTLGDQFFKQTFIALGIAFVLMGIVVFIYFRTLVPSAAVIMSALSDIVVTAAIVNVFGMKLSTAGIAAFLMLIGYSVDTDILLTTKMLKGKGSMFKRYMDAFKTGGTMTATTILAVTVAMIFTQSLVIKQIMIIVLVGLLVDIMNTWLLNAGVLRMYVEKKGGSHNEK